MGLVVGVDPLALGGNEVERAQAVGSDPEQPLHPREAAAEQIAADPRRRARPDGEVEAALDERLLEDLAAGGGSN